MGQAVTATLVRPGFYPAGGGEFTVDITPAADGRFRPIELTERGEIVSRRARAIVAQLPEQIAERELKVVGRKLGWSAECLSAEKATKSTGPGNIIMLEIESENVTEVFTAFGEINAAPRRSPARPLTRPERTSPPRCPWVRTWPTNC